MSSNIHVFKGTIETIHEDGRSFIVKLDSLVDTFQRAVVGRSTDGWKRLELLDKLYEGVLVHGLAKRGFFGNTLKATRIYDSIVTDKDETFFDFTGAVSKVGRFFGGQDAVVTLDAPVDGLKYAVIHGNSFGQHALLGKEGKIIEGLSVRGKGYKMGEALFAIEIDRAAPSP